MRPLACATIHQTIRHRTGRIRYTPKQTCRRPVSMRAFVLCASFCTALTSVALAQGSGYAPPPPQPDMTQGGGVPLSPLPPPDVPDNSKPSDFLRAAQAALASNHPREAEEALERAQTRMLDRSVPLGETGNPSDNPTAVQIAQ